MQGEQEEVGKYKDCFYPTYQMLIDWNGNVYLCPQDWQRKVSMGNIMQETIFDQIWTGKTITDLQKKFNVRKKMLRPMQIMQCQMELYWEKIMLSHGRDVYKI